MKRIQIILLALLLGSGFVSCTVDFGDINEDPNRIKNATPESFLNSALHRVTWIQMQYGHRLSAEFVQHTTQTNEINEFHRYIVPSTESNSIWSRHYTVLTDIADMEQQSEAREAVNYQAIAKVMKVWTFASLTDIFGPVPYSQALKGDSDETLQPEFNTEEEIYTSLIAELEQANNLFDTENNVSSSRDILFQGDVLKWKKFANSLRLRLLLRASSQLTNAPADIAEIYNNPATYPVFQTMDEAAILNFTGERPNINPFSDWRDFEFNGNRGMSEFFINTLEGFTDPRLEQIAASNDEGEYIGVLSGRADTAPEGYSTYKPELKDSEMPAMILSHAEVEFIWAEAAQKGWISGDAATHYEQGIEKSMEFWGVDVPAGYLTQEGVAYDDQLETIMLQKWIALFWSGLEAWHEYRRTKLPGLTPGPAARNNGIVPTRLLYPSTLQTLNGGNYQTAVQMIGSDDLQARLWWQP